MRAGKIESCRFKTRTTNYLSEHTEYRFAFAYPYASGVGRRWIGLFWQPAFEPGRVFFVHPEEIDQVFDAEVGERLDTILPDAVDPDGAILDLHFDGDIAQQIFIFTKILCDLGNGGDVVDFIDVGGHGRHQGPWR